MLLKSFLIVYIHTYVYFTPETKTRVIVIIPVITKVKVTVIPIVILRVIPTVKTWEIISQVIVIVIQMKK